MPAVILLEDLDRAFPRSGGSSSKISMQTPFNCLDGISTAPGVITIATANEPSLLDPAILRRPGRFDRVILFGPPSPELRQEYLEKIHASMAEYDLRPVVLETEGFSYALLQQCYILAAQSAREADRALTVEDMVESAGVLRGIFKGVAKKSDASGFASKASQRRAMHQALLQAGVGSDRPRASSCSDRYSATRKPSMQFATKERVR